MAIEDVGKRFCVMLRTDGRYSKTSKSVAGSALSAIKEPLQNLKCLIISAFRTVIKIGDYFYRNRAFFLVLAAPVTGIQQIPDTECNHAGR